MKLKMWCRCMIACLLFSTMSENLAQGLLSGGNSLKIAVEKDGIYEVRYEDLVESGLISSPTERGTLALIGRPAGLLPFYNDSSMKTGLMPMPILMQDGDDGIFGPGDRFYFYGQSPNVLLYNAGDPSHPFQVKIHPYDTRQYYFVTLDAGSHREIPEAEKLDGQTEIIIRNFPDFARHEAELHNPLQGTLSWLGEAFEQNGQSHKIEVELPCEPIDGLANVRVSAFFLQEEKNTETPCLQMELDGQKVSLSKTSLGTYQRLQKDSILNVSANNRFKLRFSKADADTTLRAWLDFVQISFTRPLEKRQGQALFFRSPEAIGKNSRFEIGGNTDNLRVWDISQAEHVANQTIKAENGLAAFTIPASDSLRQFVAFAPEDVQRPLFSGLQKPQDLALVKDAEYLIVTHPLFKAQAEALAAWHRQEDGYSTCVATTTEVFNEFSSGVQDPSAIRLFAKSLYEKSASKKPRYLLLFGAVSYDYKDIYGLHSSFVPTFSPDEDKAERKYLQLYEDAFGYLENGEGLLSGTYNPSYQGDMDIAVGRIPVHSAAEADAMVRKIQRYSARQYVPDDPTWRRQGNFGPWKNDLVFVGGQEFVGDMESWIDQTMKDTDTLLNIHKIYSGFDTLRQAEARQKITAALANGAFYIGYMGHGDPDAWGNDRLLKVENIQNWEESYAYPILFSFACSFATMDNPFQLSGTEAAVLHPDGGCIAAAGATGEFHIGSGAEEMHRRFLQHLLQTEDGNPVTLGDAWLKAKQESRGLCVPTLALIGDPGLKIPLPANRIRTLEINGNPVQSESSGSPACDTLRALASVAIHGQINGSTSGGLADPAFNGTLFYHLYDKPDTLSVVDGKAYLRQNGTYVCEPDSKDTVTYASQERLLLSGKTEVKDGKFRIAFQMPRHIAPGIAPGKLSYYAYDPAQGMDASGCFTGFMVGGIENNASVDSSAPLIYPEIVYRDIYAAGKYASVPYLQAEISDRNGLNLSGIAPGKDLRLTVNENENEAIVLNDYFCFDAGTSRSGVLEYPLLLPSGDYCLHLQVWNIFDIAGYARIDFHSRLENETELLAGKESGASLLAMPNPAKDQGFTDFLLRGVSTWNRAELQIYNITGRLLCTHVFSNTGTAPGGQSLETLRWNWPSSGFRSGLYICRLVLHHPDGQTTATLTTKLLKIE